MIAGHLQEKSGYWYAVLSVRDEEGRHKQKWVATHLRVKGNKKRAEEMLTEFRIKYTGLEDIRRNSRGIFFDEYMATWIADMEGKVAPSTYNGYRSVVMGSICPYFRKHSIMLNDLKPIHIEAYYNHLHEREVSNNTIIRHHANLRKALKQSFETP